MKNRNKILEKGGMMLEVMLMLGIVIAIYPMIQSQSFKQAEKIQNILVAKELLKIKGAFEGYIKKNYSFLPYDTCSINVYDLKYICKKGGDLKNIESIYSFGLRKNMGKYNILDQKYSVRIKKRKIKNKVDIVEAIVISSGNDIMSSKKIREIVKETGFSGGYIDSSKIIGSNWELDTKDWGSMKNDSIIAKLSPSQRERNYLSRIDTGYPEDSTMKTDLYLNKNSIENIANINITNLTTQNIIAEEVDIDSSIEQINTTADIIISKDMDLENMNIVGSADFGSNDIEIKNDGTLNFNDTIEVTGNAYAETLKANKLDITNSAQINNIESDAIVRIDNLIETATPAGSSTFNLNSTAIYAKSIKAKDAMSYIKTDGTCGDCILYLDPQGSDSKFNDLIIIRLNEQLNGATIGSLHVNEKTTVGEIIEAIHEHWKNVYTSLTDVPIPDDVSGGPP